MTTITTREPAAARANTPALRMLAAAALLALTFLAASQLRACGDAAPPRYVSHAQPIPQASAVVIALPKMRYGALPDLLPPRRSHPLRSRRSQPAADPLRPHTSVAPSSGPVESASHASPQTHARPEPPRKPDELIVQ